MIWRSQSQSELTPYLDTIGINSLRFEGLHFLYCNTKSIIIQRIKSRIERKKYIIWFQNNHINAMT